MDTLSPQSLLVVIGILFVALIMAIVKIKRVSTKQKVLEKNLANIQAKLQDQLNQDKKLLKTVCHDLANPIMIIGSYVSMIKSGRVSKDNMDDIVNKIQSNSDSALSLISRIKENSLNKKDP